jgi:ABC-type transporter Mla maintaining outer membrane lipid asymmetry permease subunit MlaE
MTNNINCVNLLIHLRLLALALGGVHHAALLTNLFDAAGFLAAALVSYFAMELGKTANWIPLLGALAAGGGIAAFTMAGAMRLAMVRDSRRREQI